MNEMNGKEIEGEEIEIVLAKPPDKKRKERQAARQASRSTAWVFILEILQYCKLKFCCKIQDSLEETESLFFFLRDVY